MRNFVCTVGILLLCSVAVAQTSESAADEASDVDVQLAAHDTNAVRVVRDPFWPVGYTPAPPEPEEPEKDENEEELPLPTPEKWPILRIKGLSKGGSGRRMAILDRVGIVEEGDTISFEHENLVYQWLIEEISDKGVFQKRLGVQRSDKGKKAKADNN